MSTNKTYYTMKLIKLIFICVCLITTFQITAQDLDPTDIYYALELTQITTKNDTADTYQVTVVINTSDLHLFTNVSVESSKKTKDLKVTKEERKDNPLIKVKNKNYQLDMQEWSKDEELIVKGKLPDGKKVKLKKHPRASEFTHKVVTLQPKTRDLKKNEGPEIVEQEN